MYVFSNAIRVSPRFAIGVVISFFLITVHLVMRSQKNLNKYVKLLFTLLVLVNLSTFYPFISFQKLITNSKIDFSTRKLSSKIYEVPWRIEWPYTLADHLPSYASGKIIRNCYNPLFLGQSMNNQSQVNLTDSENEVCIRDSFVTQNKIKLSATCEKDLCLNLRDIPDHLKTKWKYIDSKKQFCRKNF